MKGPEILAQMLELSYVPAYLEPPNGEGSGKVTDPLRPVSLGRRGATAARRKRQPKP